MLWHLHDAIYSLLIIIEDVLLTYSHSIIEVLKEIPHIEINYLEYSNLSKLPSIQLIHDCHVFFTD